MNKLLGIVVIFTIFIIILSGNENNSGASKISVKAASTKSVPSDCNESTEITGKKYNVLGSDINIRKGPGIDFDKIINQKATDIMKTTHYITIDDSTTVFEECIKDDWSWIRVIEPNWLQNSHRGWVASRFLDKGQDIGGDKYARKISPSAFSPYSKEDYPDTFSKYGSRINEIEILRRKAAEVVVDSGKCDYVLMSELSMDNSSTVDNPQFWIDCRNKQRIYISELQIKNYSPILTQEEKSWDKHSAISACQKAIKDRALIPSKVDIHTILGTTYYKAPATHNVVLRMDFNARNALGTEIPYTATCHFEPGEIGSIEIQPR